MHATPRCMPCINICDFFALYSSYGLLLFALFIFSIKNNRHSYNSTHTHIRRTHTVIPDDHITQFEFMQKVYALALAIIRWTFAEVVATRSHHFPCSLVQPNENNARARNIIYKFCLCLISAKSRMHMCAVWNVDGEMACSAASQYACARSRYDT